MGVAKMQFGVRDLIWAAAFAGLVIARFLDEAATRERELTIERLAHRVDQDVHSHLDSLNNRILVLEGWSSSIDRQRDDDVRRDQSVDQSLSGIITDILELKRKQPAPKGAGS